MENKINLSDIAAELSTARSISRKSADSFMELFFTVVEEYVIRDKVVKIKGLGTFKLIDVNDRESVNVNSGERFVIAGHSKISFTPDKALKDAVNRPFAEFETVALNDNVNLEAMEKTEAPVSEGSKEVQSGAEAPVQEGSKEVPEGSKEVPEGSKEVQSGAEAPVQEGSKEVPDGSKEVLAPSVAPSEPMPEPIPEPIPEPTPESETPAESKAAAKAAAAAAEAAAKAAAAVAEAAAKATPVAVQPAEPKKSCVHAWLWGIVTVVLMVLCYVVGFYMGGEQKNAKCNIQNAKVETISKPSPTSASASTLKPSSASTSKPAPSNEDLAKQYPQLEGGEYLIVGELDHVHHMQVGETLYKIAGKELGSQKLMPYIMIFNKYPDDIVLHPDDPIRLPKLVKK